jgi:Sec-independent protein secretion pathway component TatC
MSFLFLFLIFYIYIDSLLYIFSKEFLLSIDSSKFFFSDVRQLFWMYLKIAFWVTSFCILPFFLLTGFIYVLPSFYLKELKVVIFWKCLFLMSYYINLYVISTFIIPNILFFFLQFNVQNEFFMIHFEAKFEEYFNFLIKLYIIWGVSFAILFIIIFLNLIHVIKDFFIFTYKKYIYIFFLSFSILLSPPDFFLQISYICVFVGFFETFFFFKLFWKNF